MRRLSKVQLINSFAFELKCLVQNLIFFGDNLPLETAIGPTYLMTSLIIKQDLYIFSMVLHKTNVRMFFRVAFQIAISSFSHKMALAAFGTS